MCVTADCSDLAIIIESGKWWSDVEAQNQRPPPVAECTRPLCIDHHRKEMAKQEMMLDVMNITLLHRHT
jgi:hypothetical protein